MIKVNKTGILLTITSLDFENEGVLNPGVIQTGEYVHLFYRAVGKGNHSTIGYCRLEGPVTIVERLKKPLLTPLLDFESQGIEDARIVMIDGIYYLTYTGYNGSNALGALATSNDLINFERQGIIVPPVTYASFVLQAQRAGKLDKNYYQNPLFYNHKRDEQKTMLLWDKDLVFFPRRINGKLVYLHRIRPGIQIVSVNDLSELTLDFWETYLNHLEEHIILDPVFKHESFYVGAGCPPIETEHGWLLIYHGVRKIINGRIYSACAALLDLNNPAREIVRLPYALFSPEFEWELKGEVNNVVFPTGTARFGDDLYIYYGAADTHVACASLNINELLGELLMYKEKNEK